MAEGKRTVEREVTRLRNRLRVLEEAAAERRETEQEALRILALESALSWGIIKGKSLQETLKRCTEAIVEHLNTALARIWLHNEETGMLELQTSAGLYTHIDGPHGRVPVGSFKIGMIAKERRPHLTNTVIGDPRIHDQEWAKREKMVAFAGYPLVVDDRLIGVVAVFARRPLSDLVLTALASVAERIGFAVDRIRNEEALQRNEERFRAMIEHGSDAIVLLDSDLKVQYASASTARVLGYEPGALLGSSALNLVYPEDRDAAQRTLADVMRQPGSTLGVELRLRRSDGDDAWYEWVTSNCFNNVHVRAIIVNARDITQRKKIEETVRKKEQLASLGLLAGGVAHDFNNLLTGIVGNATLALTRNCPADSCDRYLNEIIAAANRAADLTRRMLAYAGKGRFVSKAVDVSYLICKTEPEMRRAIPPSVELALQLAPGLPLVAADPSLLEQLVFDLVINASEAIEPGEPGTITVRTEVREIGPADVRAQEDIEPGTHVEIEVRDTGCGMDEATMARVFDPFFTTKFPGRGLGLAAVSGIVRSHRGLVRVSSTPGRGSSFQVLLPAR